MSNIHKDNDKGYESNTELHNHSNLTSQQKKAVTLAKKDKEKLKVLQYFYRNIVDIMNCGENQRHTIPYIYELIDEVKNILKNLTTKKAKS